MRRSSTRARTATVRTRPRPSIRPRDSSRTRRGAIGRRKSTATPSRPAAAANLIPASGSRVVITNLGNKNLTDPSNRVVASNSAITRRDPRQRRRRRSDARRRAVVHQQRGRCGRKRQQEHDRSARSDGPTRCTRAGDRDVRTDRGRLGRVLRDERRVPACDRREKRASKSGRSSRRSSWASKSSSSSTGPRRRRTTRSTAACVSRSRRITTARSIPPAKRCFLYVGLGRGGDSYYGLDVTRPDSPQLMWHLRPYEPPRASARTWSTPVPTKMLVNGSGQSASNFVLVLGGGYEPDQDNVTTSTDATGNSIYIVDSETGALLWQGTKTGGTKSFNATGKAWTIRSQARSSRRLRRRRLRRIVCTQPTWADRSWRST